MVLGADRAVLLNSLADASSSRVGLGYETVVTRLDDEANIAPWLRAANRYGAKVKWAEVDIETGELPTWQWENLITDATRLVAVTSASATLGTVTDLRAATKLLHVDGGLVIVDHSAAAPYRLIDIDEIDADVVAVNAIAWGGPPVGALVFRDPDMIDTFGSIALNPYATGAERLETRRAPVPPAGRSGREHRVPGVPRRVGEGNASRTASRLNAIRGFLHDEAVRLPADLAAVAANHHGHRQARGLAFPC